MFRKKKTIVTMVCPNCGAVIPAKSPACPECGSDEETGWSEKWDIEDELTVEEDPAAVQRRRVVKNLIRIGFSIIGAIAIGAFLAVEIPIYGIFIAAAVVAGVIIALIVFRERPPSAKRTERNLEQELLALSGRDPARLERLVMYERSRAPDASRPELLKRAIDRLVRDRSR
jgi:hypothetical protein